jgi:hypothetical protein
MTLVETLIALGLGSLVLSTVMSFTGFTARSFGSLGCYYSINSESRAALDRMTRDIRQTDFLTSYTANKLVFQTTDPNSTNRYTLAYTYSPGAGTLTRTFNGNSTLLLTDCTCYHFDLYQRNPSLTNGGELVSLISTNQPRLVKAIDISWVCARTLQKRTNNTEVVQSARVVIRKN